VPKTLVRVAPAVVALALATAGPAAQEPQTPPPLTAPFESYLELLRLQAGIPGLSAAIVHEGQIAWERGFGYQDLEARIAATPDTPYLVGGISETLAAVLLLQCVEIRRMDIDQPVSTYGVSIDPNATLRQVLSHTLPGDGGGTFSYDPQRFSQLTYAMEWCAPQSYRKSVSHRLLERLAMIDSVPGRDLSDRTVVPEELWDPAILERYGRVLQRLAVPYRIERRGHAVRSELAPLETINAASGLVTTVRDFARFDAALDGAILLKQETLQVAWRNVIGRDGLPTPMGLGWFVQTHRNQQVVWHFGHIPHAYSALVIKVPARRLTLILLANSDGLAAPYQLPFGDVTKSIFGNLFLRLFT
jgi:CubicO group peptidase (beta-lactamase class C family)